MLRHRFFASGQRPNPNPGSGRRVHPAALVLAAAAALALAPLAPGRGSPADGGPTVVLVKAGDAVADIGVILSIDDVAIGDDGSWLARVRTDFPNPARDEVILRNGVAWLREGDALPKGPDLVLTGLDGDLALDAWSEAWSVVRDTNGGGGASIIRGGTAVLSAGDDAVFGPLPPGTTWSDLIVAVPVAAGVILVRGEVDDGADFRDALALAGIGADGRPELTGRLVAGESLAGLGIVGRIPANGSEAVAIARDGGAIVASVDLEGESAAVDGVLLRWTERGGWAALAREGDPSPVAGRTWSGLQGRSVAAGPGGAWAVQGSLSGAPSSNQVIVRDGAVFVQEGDTVSLADGDFLLQGFGVGPLRLIPDGRLIWLADWDDTIGFDRGIFAGPSLVLRAGTTRIDGVAFGERIVDDVLLSGLDLGPANWDASPSGAWLIARGTVRDPGTGADLAAAVRTLILPPCAADADGDGAVTFTDLIPVLAAYGAADDPADVDGDRDVDFADLVLVLTTWGACGP